MSHNTDLKTYPLPQRLLALLAQSDAIAQSMARSGRPVPASAVLFASDFDAIDRVVRVMTNGTVTAAQTHWNGRPIARYAEPLVCAG